MQNRRKHIRHEVNYSCWLAPPSTESVIRGQVRNISEGGAKVVCGSDLPDTIDMFMTKDGKVGRRCKVVWRAEGAIGLMFLNQSQKTAPARHSLDV